MFYFRRGIDWFISITWDFLQPINSLVELMFLACLTEQLRLLRSNGLCRLVQISVISVDPLLARSFIWFNTFVEDLVRVLSIVLESLVETNRSELGLFLLLEFFLSENVGDYLVLVRVYCGEFGSIYSPYTIVIFHQQSSPFVNFLHFFLINWFHICLQIS